jgi:hypothetical protein
LLPALADRQDDPAGPRDLATRDQKIPRCIVLLQEGDVRRHMGVDLGEIRCVGQFDHEHGRKLTRCSRQKLTTESTD